MTAARKVTFKSLASLAGDIVKMFNKKKVGQREGIAACLFVAFEGMVMSDMSKEDAEWIISVAYESANLGDHFEKVSRETKEG